MIQNSIYCLTWTSWSCKLCSLGVTPDARGERVTKTCIMLLYLRQTAAPDSGYIKTRLLQLDLLKRVYFSWIYVHGINIAWGNTNTLKVPKIHGGSIIFVCFALSGWYRLSFRMRFFFIWKLKVHHVINIYKHSIYNCLIEYIDYLSILQYINVPVHLSIYFSSYIRVYVRACVFLCVKRSHFPNSSENETSVITSNLTSSPWISRRRRTLTSARVVAEHPRRSRRDQPPALFSSVGNLPSQTQVMYWLGVAYPLAPPSPLPRPLFSWADFNSWQ